MRRPAITTMIIVGAALVLSGCGRGTTPAGPVSPSLLATELTVRYQSDGGGKAASWTLTCDPSGGDHPRPKAACAALDAHGATALPTTKAGTMCTEIYGGAQRATISGRWRGEAVNATLSRVNGCEIDRWSALEGLVPKAD